MTAKLLSSFAGGLIVATAVFGSVYYFGPSEATSTQQIIEKPSEEEMKSLLASEGYVIHSEEEWQERLAAAEAVETVEAAEVVEMKEDNVEEVPETIVYHTILSVSPGMTSIDVGEALVRANIIDSAMEFFNEVEKRGLSNGLRPGTYEIESKMTLEEIIATIFQ